MSINILYCFDENYNLQALTSMISLLDETSEIVDIYIVHNNPESFTKLSKIIKSHKKVGKILITKFDKQNFTFPNVENSHVSEATYYRLFIEDLLPEQLDYVLYLDADIICYHDPSKEIQNVASSLLKSENTIASVRENFDDTEKNDINKRLNIDADKYFNAGAMFIDLKSWRKKSIMSASLEIINQKNKDLKFWDQDVLNVIFNNDLIEINNSFNYIINIEKDTLIPEETIFLHYAGSFKPWTVRGAIEKNSIYYMEQYRKLNLEKFHITHTWKLSSLIYLIRSLFNLKIINTKYPISFLSQVIRTLLR